MKSGHAVTIVAPVLSAGVGVRYQGSWVLRLVSFRLERSDLGRTAMGVVTRRSAASAALTGLLTGRLRPTYGSLEILGYDMATIAGRTAVGRQVGMVSRSGRPISAMNIRHFIERAARNSGQPGSDRHLLVAAILDRLALTPWSEVPIGAAPELIARKARLAAACVHQPKLLVIDGLLDHLPPLDLTVLADVVRDVGRDTAIIALGADADILTLVCDQVVPLAKGVLVGKPALDRLDTGEFSSYAARHGHVMA